jgi:hypothetical protein
MKKKNISFRQALDWTTSVLGLSKKQFDFQIELPFGGFYRKYTKQKENPETEIETYSDSVLEPFANKFNIMFFADGIDFETQEFYNIGLDIESGRIAIPIFTFDNKLAGIMGRKNDPNCPKEERYLPIIPCAKSLTLFGWNQNYEYIQSKDILYVFESEKSVMQLNSIINVNRKSTNIKGCNGLAVGGCCISNVQAKYIKSLIMDVVVGFDEDREENQIVAEAQKLKILNNRVGYIWDGNNEVLRKGSKMSPTDGGKDMFQELTKNYIKWI